MLLAHAPAGYLITRLLSRTVFKDLFTSNRSEWLYRKTMFAGILGGILPDFDFFYQIFIDPNKTPHHSYITHLPVFWITLMGISLLVHKIQKDKKSGVVLIALCSGALLHVMCDTLTGVIYWLYPLSNHEFNIFNVSGTHIWWVHNYMYHWTFLIEIAIILTAMSIFLRIKETVAYLAAIFNSDKKLRAILMRIGVCTMGIIMIILVGSLKFNVDNKIFNKVMMFKHQVEQKAFNSR